LKSFKDYLEIIIEAKGAIRSRQKIRKQKPTSGNQLSPQQAEKTASKSTDKAIDDLNININNAYSIIRPNILNIINDNQNLDFNFYNELYKTNYDIKSIKELFKNLNIYQLYNDAFNSNESKEQLKQRKIGLEILALFNQEVKLKKLEKKINIAKMLCLEIRDANTKTIIKFTFPNIIQ
jgi:hypothetical protein